LLSSATPIWQTKLTDRPNRLNSNVHKLLGLLTVLPRLLAELPGLLTELPGLLAVLLGLLADPHLGYKDSEHEGHNELQAAGGLHDHNRSS